MVRQGDTTFQDEAVILPSAKVGAITRDVSLASGTQAIVGVGFRPSAVNFIAIINSTSVSSDGFSDGISDLSVGVTNVDLTTWDDFAINMDVVSAGNNRYRGDIQSFDADGFTIIWDKLNLPTGTARIRFIAFK